jgi:hypothetical protein
VILAALTSATLASAQEPSKADLDRARTLFQEGVALAAANNCAAALVKYKAVAQVKMTAQVAFNTAECEERLGKLVSALGNYRVAASQAQGDKRAAAVLKEVPNRIDALEARIPKLTVSRGRGAEAASISLDGTEVGASQLGSPVPVDPGPHIVTARVGDKEQLRETVNINEKEAKTFVVRLNLPEPKKEEEPPPPPPPPPPPEKSRAPGIAITVVGGGLLIAGFSFLAPRQSAISELEMVCMNGRCPASAESTGNRGRLFTGLSEGFVVGGVVGVAVGIALIATSGPQKAKDDKDAPKGDEKKDEEKKDARRPTFHLAAGAPGADVGGLSLVGRF